jgi:hypothetical protein
MGRRCTELVRSLAGLPAGSCFALALVLLGSVAGNPAFAAELRNAPDTLTLLRLAQRAMHAAYGVDGEHTRAADQHFELDFADKLPALDASTQSLITIAPASPTSSLSPAFAGRPLNPRAP